MGENALDACNNLHDGSKWVVCDGFDAWHLFGYSYQLVSHSKSGRSVIHAKFVI